MRKFLVTLFLGWAGVHKFMEKKKGLGVLYLLTLGLFGIGWIVDIIKAASMIGKTKNNTAYINSLYSEMTQHIAYQSAARPYIEKYYKGLEEIETLWSVMYNLKIVNGEQADSFETKCIANINDLHKMLEVQQQCGFDSSFPFHVPAYVRLAMLYEKQERYEAAINICVESIRAGAINDGSKGKMYSRLARLIRKSGIAVDDDIFALSTKTK